MKITRVTRALNHTAFDVFVEFEVWEESWYPSNDLTKITEICKWCGETFKENYILLEYNSLIISGGNTNNKKNWNGRLNNNRSTFKTGAYQLRCSDEDCTIFLLKYIEEDSKC